VEVVASLSQGRTAAVQCGLFTHKSVPVIFEPPCTLRKNAMYIPYQKHSSDGSKVGKTKEQNIGIMKSPDFSCLFCVTLIYNMQVTISVFSTYIHCICRLLY